jgi:hypothetical protein
MQTCITPGDRRISWPIRKTMVIQVMSWNPHQRRIAVKNRQQMAKSMIQSSYGKCRLMIVIMRNHSACNRQVTGGRTEEDHG